MHVQYLGKLVLGFAFYIGRNVIFPALATMRAFSHFVVETMMGLGLEGLEEGTNPKDKRVRMPLMTFH